MSVVLLTWQGISSGTLSACVHRLIECRKAGETRSWETDAGLMPRASGSFVSCSVCLCVAGAAGAGKNQWRSQWSRTHSLQPFIVIDFMDL